MPPPLYTDLDRLLSATVHETDLIHVATTPSRPNALLNALARRASVCHWKLEMSVTALHGNLHVFAMTGLLRKLITGFIGDNYPKPRPHAFYAMAREGIPCEVELWSLLTLVLRLRAAALNLPVAVTASLTGSDLGRDLGSHVKIDGKCALVPPLVPDVTLLHGACATPEGDVVLTEPAGEGLWGALAARRGVVVTVEAIVPTAQVRTARPRYVLNHNHVLGLAECPFGAHPQSLSPPTGLGVPRYYDDFEFLEDVAQSSRSTDPWRWFDNWILSCSDDSDYRRKLGRARLEQLSKPYRPKLTRPLSAHIPPQERLAVLAMRYLTERMRADAPDVLIAGIGMAHIGAWAAAEQFEHDGHRIEVIAELGQRNMHPYHGDTFLFSPAHVRPGEGEDVEEILGCLLSTTRAKLATVGASQVDELGQVNTMLGTDGSFLVGSGGSNDILATTPTVVITRSGPERLPSRVAHVTSPGTNVRAIVTENAVFERTTSSTFALTQWLPSTDVTTPEEFIASRCGWEAPLSDELRTLMPISHAERDCIRRIDPEGIYT